MSLNEKLQQITDWLARKRWYVSGGTFTWNAKVARSNALVLTHPKGLTLEVKNIRWVPSDEGKETRHPAVAHGFRRHCYMGDCAWKLEERQKSAIVIFANPISREPFTIGTDNVFLESDMNYMLSYLEQVIIALFADEFIGKRQPELESAKEPWHVL